MTKMTNFSKVFRGVTGIAVAVACGLMVSPLVSHAATATISGTLSSFDVVNQTGQNAHGFELQIEGATQNDLYYTGFGQRYGSATITPYATGVYVRWQSPYDSVNQTFTKTTAQHIPGTPYSWNDCYQAGSTYATSGCEHFYQGLRQTPPGLVVTGRWLIENPGAPGTLLANDPGDNVPYPVYSFVPPPTTAPVTTVAPVVVAEVPEAPEPPEVVGQYGDAQWVKVFKIQLPTAVTGESLANELANNSDGATPGLFNVNDAAQLEGWNLIQTSPPCGGANCQKRNRSNNQGSLKPEDRSIVRRYEHYKYAGAYDALTHQAVCADAGLCKVPTVNTAVNEVGAQVGPAKLTAVNVVPDVLTITKTGGGTVSDSNKTISCGNSCVAFADSGTSVTLTADPGGNVFAGWGGACSGSQLTCTVAVTGPVSVSATFKTIYTLAVSTSNSGTITGTPTGMDRAINCGGTCSAKFIDGTIVTLTATPPAGKSFVNWSSKSPCPNSTAPVCMFQINAATTKASAQAIFSK